MMVLVVVVVVVFVVLIPSEPQHLTSFDEKTTCAQPAYCTEYGVLYPGSPQIMAIQSKLCFGGNC